MATNAHTQQQQNGLPFPAPASLHSSFAMLPVSLDQDLDQMTDIYYSAFAADPANCFWWAPTREQQQRWLKQRIIKKFADPSVRHYKIVHVESGDIAAWARWDIPEGADGFGGSGAVGRGGVDVSQLVDGKEKSGAGSQGAQALSAAEAPSTTTTAATTTADAGENPKKKGLEPPEGANPAWCEAFFGALVGMHEKWDAGKMLGKYLPP